MIYKKLIGPFICAVFILTRLDVSAQVVLFQNTVDKLESFKNFSYQYVSKKKEVFSDTLTEHGKLILLKVPEDRHAGYIFKQESILGTMTSPTGRFYVGNSLSSPNSSDSIYDRNKAFIFNFSVLGELKWLKNFLKKNPSKIAQSNDTIINSINSYHLIFIINDTIVNKEHLYLKRHLFIDKATGLPVSLINNAKTADFGKEATEYYTETNYFNYNINQDNINLASFTRPESYQVVKQQPKIVLLPSGSIAPDWSLYDSEGKKVSLSQLKGKVVILDFFFIGCVPCMHTLAPLDKLHEKYKNKGLMILSISDRDNKKLVAAFKNAQRIKNQMLPNGADVVKLYHVTGFPTFYLIDREGKIGSTVNDGDPDSLQEKMSAAIDKLLK